MKKKISSLFLCLIMLALICACFVSQGLAKYVTDKSALWGDEQEVNYTVNSVFTVRSQDELFAAINQGYSYIQLDKDIENPLIVTQKAETLDSDLILDLNGIEIQRNGYEPILNIKDGVRLTVVDTSKEQTGGLYNPVGSVFNIVGGTLTVVTGKFESGPRYSEYYSYNTDVLYNGGNTKRTLVEDEPQNVVFTDTSKGITKAPIIKSYPTKTGEITYNHGNLYFDQAVTKGDFTIAADTYCYYRTNEESSIDASDIAAADWNYSYYVKKNDFSYYAATLAATDNEDDYTHITIYGYENTIKNAESIDEQKDYYAAVQMQSGALEVQKGEFFSYFGVDTTACVNAVGGSITVKRGNFSSRIPDASSYSQNSITVKESDSLAFDAKYFSNFVWSSDTLTKKGEGYCILNGGKANVTLGQGTFYSSNNNIISMSGGVLNVGGGKFTKRNTIALTSGIAENNNAKTAAIYMVDGVLDVTNAEYIVYGDYTTGIYMEDGALEISESSYALSGDNTHGIYSKVSGLGQFTLKNTPFTMTDGNNQVGIYAEKGGVRLSATADTLIKLSGSYGKGIYVAGGGAVEIDGYDFTLNGYGSSAIYSAGGSVTVQNGAYTLTEDESAGIYSSGGKISVTDTEIVLTSNISCYGIYAVSETNVNDLDITLNRASLSIGYDSNNGKSGTVVSSIGVFLDTKNVNDTVTLSDTDIYCYEVGVALSGGSLNIDGTGEIITKYASAIVVFEGDLQFEKTSAYTITSSTTNNTSVTNSYEITIPLSNGTLAYDNHDGVYVSGGNFVVKGSLTLSHTGLYNDVSTYTHYNNLTIASYAVRVVGGSVSLMPVSTDCTIDITANIGGGVYCSLGTIVLGNENFSRSSINDCVKVSTTGTQTSGAIHGVASSGGQGWNIPKTQTGGPAIELNGGNIYVYNGTYTAAYCDAVLAKIPYSESSIEAVITIKNGYFEGNMGGATGYSGPAASYGVKVIGGATVKIDGGEFYGTAGGASVTGISNFTSVNDYSGNWAKVYVSAGTFATSENTDGFMVFDMAKVVLGCSTNESDMTNSAIVINASLCPISVNRLNLSGSMTAQASYVYIYYGTYNGGQSVCWNENTFSYIKMYNKHLGNSAVGGKLSYGDQINVCTSLDSINDSGYRCVSYEYHTSVQKFSETQFTAPTGYKGG